MSSSAVGPPASPRSPAGLGPADERTCGRILRGDPRFPSRLELRMGDEAPPCVWLTGDLARLDHRQVAMVGSRATPAPLLEAAERLARELSDGGWVITSGLARGADAAAFRGGAAGSAGTVAVPARGLNRIRPPVVETASGRATFMALAPPDQDFHAGLALRRNAVLASLADVLVLVASDWKGGSWHAVRRAMREGTPIVCLECGWRTPKANAWLLERKLAVALPAEAPGGAALRRVTGAHTAAQRAAAARPWIEPLDFLD